MSAAEVDPRVSGQHPSGPTDASWGDTGSGPRARESTVKDEGAQRLVGRVLDGRYAITGVLARGGMGVVYEADDVLLDRPVVVKVVAPDSSDPSSGPRLVREARVACRVQHPFVVTVFHLGLLDERDPYVVMERLVGSDLTTHLRQHGGTPISLRVAVDLLEPVAEALGALHEHGVIHRDVKPDNIFVLAGTTYPPRVKIIDFGLALPDPQTTQRYTAVGKLLGTAEYIAPECACGEPASASSDVYALASIAYEMLSGQLPFSGSGVDLLVTKTIATPAPLTDKISTPWAADVGAVLMQALDRDPRKRPSAVDLVVGLRAIADREWVDAPATAIKDPSNAFVAADTMPQTVVHVNPAKIPPLMWATFATAVLALLAALAGLVH